MKKMMFNDKYGLTKAVLEERKTMTRRIVNESFIDEGQTLPKYEIGEIVAIAQSYENAGLIPHSLVPKVDGSIIAASNHKGWNNKMFVKPELMPHQIRITNVRIERLQDISDKDCLAEGIEFDGKAQTFYCGMNFSNNAKIWLGRTPREAYAALIDKVGKKGDWASNPYVFVYEFELIKKSKG